MGITKPVTSRHHRVSCADLAADIGDTLVTEVRKLRDAQSKNLERIAHLEGSLATLQQENQSLKNKCQKLEKDQGIYQNRWLCFQLTFFILFSRAT